jgi:peptide deformylase
MSEVEIKDDIGQIAVENKDDKDIQVESPEEIKAKYEAMKKEFEEQASKEMQRLDDKYKLVDKEFVETVILEDITPEEANEIIKDMDDIYAFAEMKGGLGISGPQLGSTKKWSAAKIDGRWELFFNPKYYPSEKTHITYTEGCLSYPGVSASVKRLKHVQAQWWGFYAGEWKLLKKKYSRGSACILQHEFDHVGGSPSRVGKPKTIFN